MHKIAPKVREDSKAKEKENEMAKQAEEKQEEVNREENLGPKVVVGIVAVRIMHKFAQKEKEERGDANSFQNPDYDGNWGDWSDGYSNQPESIKTLTSLICF